MGLHCITTYKLDALKSVRQKDECDAITNLACGKDNNGVSLETSESMKLKVEKNAAAASEGLNADMTSEKTGR